MKCKKLNFKLGILLVIVLIVILIVIKLTKINEKFNLFSNDSYVESEITNYDNQLRDQQRKQRILQSEKDKENKVNSLKDVIYSLRQRFLLAKQMTQTNPVS